MCIVDFYYSEEGVCFLRIILGFSVWVGELLFEEVWNMKEVLFFVKDS